MTDDANKWAVIGADDDGLTIERTGDAEEIADWIAAAAQQEGDRWPEFGLVYMLIPPDQLPEARALEGANRKPADA